MVRIKPLEILEGVTDTAAGLLIATLLASSGLGITSYWASTSENFPEKLPVVGEIDDSVWDKSTDFSLLLGGFSTLSLLAIPACRLILEKVTLRRIGKGGETVSPERWILGDEHYASFPEEEIDYWQESSRKWREGQEQVREELNFYQLRYRQLTGNQSEPLCLGCQYYSGDAFLPCAVHPELQEIDCLDYEKKDDKPL